jgi:hypothetical protein
MLGWREYHTTWHDPFRYLSVLTASHDLLPLVIYQFVFMLPLWRTSAQRDYLQCLVDVIQMNHYLAPKNQRFTCLLWVSRCKKKLLGEGIGIGRQRERQERARYPSHSPEFPSFPDDDQVFSGPLSHTFGRSRNQAITAKPALAVQQNIDTSFVSDEPVANCNGGEPVLFEEPVELQLGRSCWR